MKHRHSTSTKKTNQTNKNRETETNVQLIQMKKRDKIQ